MRFTLFIYFLFKVYFISAQLQSPCEVGKDRYICSDNLVLETKSTFPGKWRFANVNSGVFLDPTNKKTILSGITEPVVKVYWVNNDQSCADTLEIVQPKIGNTTLLKNGSAHNSQDLILCFGDDWKANTLLKQGKSFVAYVLYKSKPPINPNIYTDPEAYNGPVIFVNNDKNDGSILQKYQLNTNDYWFLPILYNEIGAQGPVVDTNCQITGVPFKVTYLPEISLTKKEDCMLGSTQLDIQGGTSKYKITSFSPNTMLIDSTQISIGKINLSNILVKQNYSVEINDNNGCKSSLYTKFSPCPACKTDIIYQKAYCIYDSFPAPVLKQGAGIGLLELVPANETNLVFDSLTGRLNIQASKPGNYIIRNKTSLSCVNQGYTDFNIEILDTIPIPLGKSIDTICVPNPKIGDIKDISAQLITWYNKSGDKLDPAIDPAIHGTTYYCTQTIKGCESDKKSVKVFAPTVKPPETDTLQYLCNGNLEFAKNVLFPQGNSIKWYNSFGKKLNLDDKITTGDYFVSQFIGCESIEKRKVQVVQKNVTIPYQIDDSLFFCKDQKSKVENITKKHKNCYLYDLPSSTSYLENYISLEQGLYYLCYIDSISKCKSEKKKVWVNIPSFDIEFVTNEPYCGFHNGSMEFKSSDLIYTYYFNNSKINTKLLSLKSGDYLIKITENSPLTCELDTLISVGCKKADLQEILTPNADGHNDILIFGFKESYPTSKLCVFNRWGTLVYESSLPYKDDWHGQDYLGNSLPSGTYYYIIEKDINQILKSGFIELVK